MSKVKNNKPKVIQDSQEDSDSSVPIVASKTTKKQKVEEKKIAKQQVQAESSQEEDTPVAPKKSAKQVKAPVQAATSKKGTVATKKPAKQQSSQEEESSEQKPKKVVAKVKSPVQKPVAKKQKVQSSEEQSSEEVVKPKATKAAQKVTSPVQKPVAKKQKVQSSQEESSEEVVKTKAKVAQKAQIKKPSKKIQSSSEQSQEEQQVKKPIKAKSPVQKAKSPVQKAKSPVLKAKSPVQKPQATKKKEQSSQQDQGQSQNKQEEPVKKVQKPAKKVQQTKMIDEDEQGQFQVCVRGLSFQAYDSDIRDFFNECGNISFVKLLTRDDGKSKGTAFVKFSKKSSFNAALQLNGSQHLGRTLVIEQSQAKKNNNAGSFGGRDNNKGGFNQPQGNANIQTPTLFIGGLSYNSTVESITNFFSQVGEVASARIVTDKQTGKPRGFGYVEFHDVDTAKQAYKQLNGGNLDGRNIRLDTASQRQRPQGGERGNFGGNRGQFGGNRGSFGGGRGAPRNPGNSTVVLSQDDKNAKKGSIGTFAGKKIAL